MQNPVSGFFTCDSTILNWTPDNNNTTSATLHTSTTIARWVGTKYNDVVNNIKSIEVFFN